MKRVLLNLTALLLITLSAAAAPLSLQDALNTAFQNNERVQIAQQQLNQANAILDAACGKSAVTVNWTYSADPLQSSQLNENTPLYQNTLNANYNLFTGFSDQASVDKAKFNVQYNQQQLNNAERQVRYSVTQAWLAVLLAQNKVALFDETCSNLNAHLQIANERYAAKLTSKLDVLKSGNDLSLTQIDSVNAKTELYNAILDLKAAMAVPVDKDYELVVPDKNQLGLTVDYSKDNVAGRPDVIQAVLRVQMDAQDLKAADAGWWPTISVGASYNTQDATGFGASGQNYFYALGANVSYALFDSGVTRAQIRQAKAVQTGDEKALEQKKRDALVQIKKAAQAIAAAQQQVDITGRAAQSAKEELEISTMSYRAGRISNLDALDTQKLYKHSRLDHLNAIFALQLAEAEYVRVNG